MSERFRQYLPFLFKWEGTTYENDPDDPGGATKYGIDQRRHPDVNIRALTEAQATAIYLHDYWMPVRADLLPPPLDWVMMDIAVNNGRTRAVQWLQEIVGTRVDGVIGPMTLAAVKRGSGKLWAQRLLIRREAFYRAIAKGAKKKFLKGWLNRNDDLRKQIGA